MGLQNKIFLGNLDTKRDWGYAPDYVEAMWMMLQQREPDDFVVATGESHSVREFLDVAADYCRVDWKACVETDPRYFRPTEVQFLMGDSSKAERLLGWHPRVGFHELVKLMIDHDLELARQECPLVAAGHKVIMRGVAHG